ncbi:hypothetical protein NEUTE2DRAFT_53984 [Neurospora tetrasperma FGSC 2509]|nr:hypothetical protein NEUTE2DRAFT_53984 [Neurospora tetrasperma FGSC 2509]
MAWMLGRENLQLRTSEVEGSADTRRKRPGTQYIRFFTLPLSMVRRGACPTDARDYTVSSIPTTYLV